MTPLNPGLLNAIPPEVREKPKKVFVVVGVYHGVVDDVAVCRRPQRARKVRDDFNVKYEIGSEHDDINNVVLYEESIDEKEE